MGTRGPDKNESAQIGADSKVQIDSPKKPYFKDKTFLVTGGTGFLGSHLIPLLLEDGAKVRVLGRGSEPRDIPRLGVEYVEGSILDQKILAKILFEAQQEYFIYLVVSFTVVITRKSYMISMSWEQSKPWKSQQRTNYVSCMRLRQELLAVSGEQHPG
jgi:NAD(P)-dependent dehydrogenase (short-subunit alcohol dehydrogenase family)